MLAYYAQRFPLVELNYTYYRLPTDAALSALADRTPRGFQFLVKLHQSLSHDLDLTSVGVFRDAVLPLQREGRLLALLAQFPQRFHDHPANRAWVEVLAGAFASYPLAVEFRHHSWNRLEVLDWLRDRQLHIVSVDVPQLPGLYPTQLVQSSRLLYVRFHSRNAANWYAGDQDRYDYLYSDAELRTWLDALAQRVSLADRALLLFNNCRRSQAASNAERVRQLLQQAATPLIAVAPWAAPAAQQGLLF
jgi:uncharacterized protein YecE (DUF72 family)